MPDARFLPDLFRAFPLPVYTPIPPRTVSGLAFDSRRVQPGDLFVALSGAPTDGHRYIPDALGRGAAAVVGAQPLQALSLAEDAAYVQVENSRQALAHLAAAWYDFPAQKLTVIGVTGTDGKTTTVSLIHAILQAAGLRAGLVSTVSARIGDQELDTGFHVTTPDAPDVQRYLAQMVAAGLTHAVLETTSHGLAQYRVDACHFAAAAVTNITHEHLNFHGSSEAYRAAKARLFEMLPPPCAGWPRRAVLNRDDASYQYLAGRVAAEMQLSYGFHPQAELRPLELAHLPDGLRFTAAAPGLALPIVSPLVGDFNVSNILAALAVTVCLLGVDPAAAQRGVAGLRGVPGRMERIDLGQPFTALVDFAHTPNALRVALQTARRMAAGSASRAGRVIAVFGSAGARDRDKRRLMAEVSADLADLTILTAEDPRAESLDAILAEMAAAAASRRAVEGQTFWRVPDRGDALRLALSLAAAGDVVIACGKGHEQSMCFGEVEYPWDDRLALRAALAEFLGLPGAQMPILPTSKKVQPTNDP